MELKDLNISSTTAHGHVYRHQMVDSQTADLSCLYFDKIIALFHK